MRLPVSPSTAIGLSMLAGIDLILIALVLTQLRQREEIVVGAVEWTPKLAMASPARDGRSIGEYNEILTRPVFFKSRAPYVPAPEPPAPPPAATPVVAPPVNADPELTLSGIVVTNGVRRAYLVNKADSQGSWVGEGESLAGWKVLSVQVAGIKLQQNNRIVDLDLYPEPSAQTKRQDVLTSLPQGLRPGPAPEMTRPAMPPPFIPPMN